MFLEQKQFFLKFSVFKFFLIFLTFFEHSEVENLPLRPIRVKEVVFPEIDFRRYSMIVKKSNLAGPYV